MSVRAFAVTEEDENTGAVIFAKHAIVARRAGANEFAAGELAYVSCRRAPWADEYAGRKLPAHVMIAHGWHFECSGCGARIDTDWLEDEGLPLAGVIGSQHSEVFCCSRCCRKALSLRRRRKAEEQRAIDAFKTIVLRRFPDAILCDAEPNWRHHAYVSSHHGGPGWHWQQVIVQFRFPGMKIAPACLRRDEVSSWPKPLIGPVQAHFHCCAGDRDAFEVWAAATKPAAEAVPA